MRHPATLTCEQLIEIVCDVQDGLYLDGSTYCNEKEWCGADICDGLAWLLAKHGLVPSTYDEQREPLPIAAEPAKQANRIGKELVCPSCKSKEFRYIEDIQNARRVHGINGGLLVIDGFYETDGFDENGRNPRLLCSNCCEEFGLPEDLECEFV